MIPSERIDNPEATAAFTNLVKLCAAELEFVAQFNRLTGCNLGQSANRNKLDILIDEAAGYSGENEQDMIAFVAFVFEYVWLRLPQVNPPAPSGIGR